MNIGQFKQNERGVLYGHIATAQIDLARLALRPVQSDNAKAPLFEIVSRNPGNRIVQIGALWEAQSNGTGEVFLQGSVDDPSFADRLPIALFGDGEGGYRVAWRRPRRRAETIEARQTKSVPNGGVTGPDIGDDEVPY